MKKIIILQLLLFLSLTFSIPMAFAQGGKTLTPDNLLYKFQYTDAAHKDAPSKMKYISGLPEGDWKTILTQVIKFILTITGTLALISFTVSGILMVTSQGEDDAITKAKNNLLWAIGALAIIAVSYAIVLGVSQLQFFGAVDPGTTTPTTPTTTSTPAQTPTTPKP